MLIVVLPAATGWKVEVAVETFAAKLTGFVTVATPVFELVITTLAGAAPGRTACRVPVGFNDASSTDVAMVTLLSPVEPLLMLELTMTNPAGARVIVVVLSVRSVPFAVRVTVPLEASAWT